METRELTVPDYVSGDEGVVQAIWGSLASSSGCGFGLGAAKHGPAGGGAGTLAGMRQRLVVGRGAARPNR